jgi:T5SS/PEP-CTERM-associated repeat protein
MPLPFHPRLTLRVIAVCCLACVFFLGPSLRAQSFANWIDGSGNWSTDTNWDCKCVPDGNITVSTGSGNVTLDISASVNSLSGSGTLNMSGTTLTANPNSLGVFLTGTLQMDSGASISAPRVAVGTLLMSDSTISAPTGVLQSATISNSTLHSLSVQGQLTASNSVINSGSGPDVSQLQLLAPSSIVNSTVNAGLQVDLGGSLVIDQQSVFNVATGSGGVGIGFGSMTLRGGSHLNLNFGILTMSSPLGPSSLMLDGAGTAINLSGNAINLMGLGNATLTVQNGASINSQGNTDMLVGSPLPGLGTGGNSQVIVKQGGTVSVGTVLITGSFGIPSTLDVTDSGSQVTITSGLEDSGGTVVIEKQANLTADTIDIGSLDTADEGAVIVDTGGKLTLNGSSSSKNLLVGSTGRGTLTIQNGGSGSGRQLLVIGNDPGSFGTMTITGSGDGGVGSSWENAGTLYVGYAGTGTLNVNNLGELTTHGTVPGNLAAVIGATDGGVGTATVNGGTWTLGGTLQVGASGKGTLTIATDLAGATSSASVVRGIDATMGAADGSSGTVTVSGSGAKWENSGNLTVGSAGKGTLTISDGGQVSDVNGVIAANQPSGAPSFGAASSVTVTGDGSQWNNSGTLTVGINGNASLTVSNGGRVTDTNGTIGSDAIGESSVTVTDSGSVWQNSGQLLVGVGGKGTLTITNLGQVDAGSATIGGPGGVGSAVEVANGGVFNVSGPLSVGGEGQGTLTVENGGQVQSGSAQIGGTSGLGTASVLGAGSAWQVGGGAGTLSVGSSGASGALFVQQGGEVVAGQVVVNPTGTLDGQGGAIIGNVVNNGGMVTPGDATGIMTITGNYVQKSGSTLLMEIDGAGSGEFDQLLVSGLAEFDGGTIDIVFGNGFQPTAGENFDLIVASLLMNLGVNVNVEGLANGLQFASAFDSTGLGISFQGQPPPPPTSTPEPSSMFLLVSVLAAVLGSRLKSSGTNFLK